MIFSYDLVKNSFQVTSDSSLIFDQNRNQINFNFADMNNENRNSTQIYFEVFFFGWFCYPFLEHGFYLTLYIGG